MHRREFIAVAAGAVAGGARIGLWPGRDLRELLSLRQQNTVAVKLS